MVEKQMKPFMPRKHISKKLEKFQIMHQIRQSGKNEHNDESAHLLNSGLFHNKINLNIMVLKKFAKQLATCWQPVVASEYLYQCI
jgi:hypothetical protein